MISGGCDGRFPFWVDNCRFFALYGNRFTQQVMYDDYLGIWEDQSGSDYYCKAIAWMPFPTPPTLEELEAINGNAEVRGEKG